MISVEQINRAFIIHQMFYLVKKIQFKLSDIGEGIREVAIKEWFVKVGDTVAQFDDICEVQSDKAAVTITSRYDGVIRKLHYDVDGTAFVGKPLVDIELEGDADGGIESLSDVSDTEVAVNDHDGSSSSDSSSDDDAGASIIESNRKILTTPAVRRLAMENKIALKDVLGTGKDGRIMKEDVVNYLAAAAAPPPASPAPAPALARPVVAAAPVAPQAPAAQPAAVAAQPAPLLMDTEMPVRGVQKAMAKAMTLAASTPHFAYCDEIDMSALTSLRPALRSTALRHFQGAADPPALSYMPFIIKAASIALVAFPSLNAHTDAECTKVIHKAAHNIGVAMDTPAGLMVPNIKAVQERSVLDIAVELHRLMRLGQMGKLAPNDLVDATFSISNIGNVGGTYTKPVIPPPTVCIAGLGRIRPLPRFDAEDRVVKRFIMEASWSADHRVVDGATMARFSNAWKELLENPSLMLLHLK